MRRTISCMQSIPHSLIAVLGRMSIAAIFWQSGQTKIEGFALDIIGGTMQFGLPRLSAGALELFRSEYQLPFISPYIAACMAAVAEHLFPLLLVLGLATRFSALALLGITAVIQIFVYPDAYPTHGTWAAVLLYLMARGAGLLSLDHLVARGCALRHAGDHNSCETAGRVPETEARNRR